MDHQNAHFMKKMVKKINKKSFVKFAQYPIDIELAEI